MSSNSFCHGLVLKIDGILEKQIKASFAIKTKRVDELQHVMKKLLLFIKNWKLINECSTVSSDVIK